MWIAKTRTEQINDNTVLTAEDFGGWQIVNTGDTPCTVNGVILDPAGGLIGLDYTTLDPSVLWSDPISIKFSTLVTKKQVVLTRIKYTKKND